jgi:hypothetical protein
MIARISGETHDTFTLRGPFPTASERPLFRLRRSEVGGLTHVAAGRTRAPPGGNRAKEATRNNCCKYRALRIYWSP